MTRTVTFGMKRIVTNFIRKSMVEKARVHVGPRMKTHLCLQRVSKVKNYKMPNTKALY
jgi:hypothetical protein